jgi:hypothetical protein
MANTQITVSTTATLLVAADPHDQTVILHAGNAAIYIGNASVTTSNGYLMDNKDKLTLSLGAYEALYGVVTSGTGIVYVYSVIN